MSTIEYDTACYHAELRDGEELVECPSCDSEVRLEALITMTEWNGQRFVHTDVCQDCAKEGAE